MTKLRLNRTGGLLGKMLRAEAETEIDIDEIIKLLKASAPLANPLQRDSFHYSVTINDHTLPVDITRLEGKLGLLVSEMEGRLRSV